MAVGSGAGVTAGSDIEVPAWIEEGVAVGVGVGVADNLSVEVSAVGEEGVAAGVCSGSWQAARNSPAQITASRQKRNGATRESYIRPLPAASGWHDSGVTAKDTVLCCLDAKPRYARPKREIFVGCLLPECHLTGLASASIVRGQLAPSRRYSGLSSASACNSY